MKAPIFYLSKRGDDYMAEKTFNTRIQFKQDTASNWKKATGFAPKEGEAIVYSKDNNYEMARIKIGDGSTNVNNLQFFYEPLLEEELEDICNPLPYKNWVPKSIDTTGAIFNGTGYQEGYRLSSSGELKTQTNAVVTGFIPAATSDLIRMRGLSWKAVNGYSYICFYDKNFNKLAHINDYQGGAANGVSNMVSGSVLNTSRAAHAITTDSEGICTFNIAYQSGAAIAYIRISAEGEGSAMVVTLNQEINDEWGE